jgi:hypothetical protein
MIGIGAIDGYLPSRFKAGEYILSRGASGRTIVKVLDWGIAKMLQRLRGIMMVVAAFVAFVVVLRWSA